MREKSGRNIPKVPLARGKNEPRSGQRQKDLPRGVKNSNTVLLSARDAISRSEACQDVIDDMKEEKESKESPLLVPRVEEPAVEESDDYVGSRIVRLREYERSRFRENPFEVIRSFITSKKEDAYEAQVRAFWQNYTEFVQDSFNSSGYDDRGLALVRGRSNFFLARIRRDMELDLPVGWSRTSANIIMMVYYEKWSPTNWFYWAYYVTKHGTMEYFQTVLLSILSWLFNTLFGIYSWIKSWSLFCRFLLILFVIIALFWSTLVGVPVLFIGCMMLGGLCFLLLNFLFLTPVGYVLAWYLWDYWCACCYRDVTPPTSKKLEEIKDWCRGEFLERPIHETAEIELPSGHRHRYACKEQYYQVGFTFNADNVWCSRSCIHNEWDGLTGRQLLPAIGTQIVRENAWNICYDAYKQFRPPVRYTPSATDEILFDNFACRYPLSRRDCIVRARKAIEAKYYEINCDIKGFVKVEWNVYKEIDKRLSRFISGTWDEYLAFVAPMYYDYQCYLTATFWSDPLTCFQQNFIYTGALDAQQLGELFSLLERSGYKAYMGDFVKYDGHNEVEALGMEVRVYSDDFPAWFVEILSRMLDTRGVTMHGIKFKVKGKQKSGLPSTTGGNTLRTHAIFAGFFRKLGIVKGWKIMASGDDSVLFVKFDFGQYLQLFYLWVENCGHSIELKAAEDYCEIDYLSSRPINIGHTRVMVPKLGRILSKTFICNDAQLPSGDVSSHCKTVALGFKHYTWYPGLSGLVFNVLQTFESVTVSSRAARKAQNPYTVRLKTSIGDVDRDSVESDFMHIYGVDPAVIDSLLRDFQLKLGTAYHHHLIDEILRVDGCLPCL